jgi:DNA-binding TFAR19-related protein (PDSD5 family)
MEDAELEKIRQKKLDELQEQKQEQLEVQKQISQLEHVVKQRLTKEALVRFGNLKAGQPQLAVQVLIVLNQLIKSGRIDQVDDDTLRSVLQEMRSEKKGIRIIRK